VRGRVDSTADVLATSGLHRLKHLRFHKCTDRVHDNDDTRRRVRMSRWARFLESSVDAAAHRCLVDCNQTDRPHESWRGYNAIDDESAGLIRQVNVGDVRDVCWLALCAGIWARADGRPTYGVLELISWVRRRQMCTHTSVSVLKSLNSLATS
jgi:hypothetical protein